MYYCAKGKPYHEIWLGTLPEKLEKLAKAAKFKLQLVYGFECVFSFPFSIMYISWIMLFVNVTLFSTITSEFESLSGVCLGLPVTAFALKISSFPFFCGLLPFFSLPIRISYYFKAFYHSVPPLSAYITI